jgi:hypothetical protein
LLRIDGTGLLILAYLGAKDKALLVKLRREASEENYIDFIRSEFGYERRPLEQLESK